MNRFKNTSVVKKKEREMRLLLAFLAIFLLVNVGSGFAVVYTWQPPYVNFHDDDDLKHDLDDLEHGKFYTWGIDWSIPDGEQIIAAGLFFDEIRNWDGSPNDLWVHLLDTVTEGAVAESDNVAGDQFAGQGILLEHYVNLPSSSQGIPYVFDTIELNTLIAYLADDNFGFGFDPDCHFYNDGITFGIKTALVPEPASMVLFVTGLVGLAGLRRKKS